MKKQESHTIPEGVVKLFSNPYLVITVLALIVWGRALFFDFTYLDDNVLILDNINYLRNLANIVRSFSLEVFHILHASADYYRPLLTISFILDAQIGGTSLFFYHFTNILYHIGSSCLLYVLLVKMKLKSSLALFFSLVFVVHPVLTQAVVWVPGRNDSLLTLFFLASFIFFVNYLEEKTYKNLFLHVLFFSFALFTKESAILLPLIAVSYAVLIKKEKIFQSYQIKLVFSWLSMFLIWAVLRANALKGSFQYSPEGIAKSLYLNFPAVILYLGKVIFPFNLSVLPTLQDSTLLWGFLSLGLILLVLIFSKSKKRGYIVFGACWFFALLLPSFIRINTEYVADFIEHRIYLPLVGLIVIFSEVDFIKNLNFSKKIILFFCGLYLVLLSVISIIHSSNFENGMKYWQNAVTNSPHHPLAHKNLGVMYYMKENYPLAIAEYEKSLDLNPRETMVHNNLGVIYMYNKDFKKAEEEYKKELAINPYYDNAVFNYGLLYYLQGKNKEAEDWWLLTIKVNPEYVSAYRSLAILYQSLGNTDKANYYYQEALKRGATF